MTSSPLHQLRVDGPQVVDLVQAPHHPSIAVRDQPMDRSVIGPEPHVLMSDPQNGTDVAVDALDTADIYELIVERHRAAATVVTSNREPIEWLGYMADPLLAQSAIDRLQSAAHELVLDGESYRQRQKPGITTKTTLDQPPLTRRSSRRRR